RRCPVSRSGDVQNARPAPARRDVLRYAALAAGGALAGGLTAGCGSASHTHNAEPAVARPRRGGHLNVGLAGGSSSDTVDAHKSVPYLDTGRLQSLYDPLAQLDGQGKPENLLAQSITPHKGALDQWVIRLHKGVTFHNGKPLTAADVIFTFQRVLSNKL